MFGKAASWTGIAVCILLYLIEVTTAFTAVYCGRCNLDELEKDRSECSVLGGSSASTPGGPFGTLGYSGVRESRLCTRCPTGQSSCTSSQGILSDCQFLNNNTDAANCGACGNKCSGDTPSCVSGQCGCTNATLACGLDRFCDLATPEGPKKCAKCPEFFANCDSDNDLGRAADCEVDLRNSTNNCGACGLRCLAGETCTNGVCVCGAQSGRCPANTECIAGVCTQCTDPEDDSICSKASWTDVSGYCNPATKTCATCPTGFADCTSQKRLGGDDDGTADDCETEINQSGSTDHCGVCNGPCGGGGTATSCCAGTCKCGKFVDRTAPSNDECAAAVQCTETEYCEPTLQICLPLYRPNRDCTRTASQPGTSTNLRNLPYCGSCNRTIAIDEFVVNSTCVASSSLSCGKAGVQCRTDQFCENGKCTCDLGASIFLTWEPFMDKDRDGDNKVIPGFAVPRSGCNPQVFQAQLDGRFQRTQASLLAFERCISLARPEINKFTAKDLRNTTFRADVCPGTVGTCPLTFCNEVIANLTERDRGSFCGTVQWASGIAKACAQDFRRTTERAGDLTCANNLALSVLQSAESTTRFHYLDMYNLLGCDKPRDDMIYFIGTKPQVAQYRVETAYLLLGSAGASKISLLAAAASMIVCACALLF